MFYEILWHFTVLLHFICILLPFYKCRWRVGIWVTSMHLIDLKSDALWCCTTFYSSLFVYSYLCCVEFGCWLVEVLLYVHRNRRFIRDGSPGRPPRLSHSSWALVVLNCLLYSVEFEWPKGQSFTYYIHLLWIIKFFCYCIKKGHQLTSLSNSLLQRMYLWWSLRTLYLLACQVRVTAGDSGPCCCVCVTSFERWLTPFCCVDSSLLQRQKPNHINAQPRFNSSDEIIK